MIKEASINIDVMVFDIMKIHTKKGAINYVKSCTTKTKIT
jgi:hypothetical protein